MRPDFMAGEMGLEGTQEKAGFPLENGLFPGNLIGFWLCQTGTAWDKLGQPRTKFCHARVTVGLSLALECRGWWLG